MSEKRTAEGRVQDLVLILERERFVKPKELARLLGVSRVYLRTLITKARLLGLPVFETGGRKCIYKVIYYANPPEQFGAHKFPRIISFHVSGEMYNAIDQLAKTMVNKNGSRTKGDRSALLRHMCREYLGKK